MTQLGNFEILRVTSEQDLCLFFVRKGDILRFHCLVFLIIWKYINSFTILIRNWSHQCHAVHVLIVWSCCLSSIRIDKEFRRMVKTCLFFICVSFSELQISLGGVLSNSSAFFKWFFGTLFN